MCIIVCNYRVRIGMNIRTRRKQRRAPGMCMAGTSDGIKGQNKGDQEVRVQLSKIQEFPRFRGLKGR